MIQMVSESGHSKAGIYEYVVDTATEINDLPTNVKTGSIALCIENSKKYMLNGNKQWVVVNFKSGGGSGEIHICSSSEYDSSTLKPTVQGSEGVIYLVPTSEESGNLYNEYIWTGTNWEQFGAGDLKTTQHWVDGIANGSVRSNTSAEENNTYLMGENAVAEGLNTQASGIASHAEGTATEASGNYSHAEGSSTTASGSYSHAEGTNAIASEYASHAEGQQTRAQGNSSHAEGNNAEASGTNSHAEGYYTIASGDTSHAENDTTTASGRASHAEGDHTVASGYQSHAEGLYTIAKNASQHVFGSYNAQDPSTMGSSNRGNYIEIVGNGANVNNRSNARTLDWNGNETLAGSLTLGQTELTEVGLASLLNRCLIVTFTQEDAIGNYVSDKTHAEASAVLNAGGVVIAKVDVRIALQQPLIWVYVLFSHNYLNQGGEISGQSLWFSGNNLVERSVRWSQFTGFSTSESAKTLS